MPIDQNRNTDQPPREEEQTLPILIVRKPTDLPIEKKWNIPTFLLTGTVAPHMKYSPRELGA